MELEKVRLEKGAVLPSVTVKYEIHGELNRKRDNCILVCHALTGDAHVASHYPGDQTGWWEDMVGPGRGLDPRRHFILASNVLGGCYGTTGPASMDPGSRGRPYGSRFPSITVRDMVRVQHLLVKRLGVRRVLGVIGGSLGGMQALEWGVMYPEMVDSVISIAACAQTSAQAIAWSHAQRMAVVQDPAFRKGDYYGTAGPRAGLALARMMGIITYKSGHSLEHRFGRCLNPAPPEPDPPETCFSVESYLNYQGKKLVERFDANSYVLLSRAMDLHDVGRGRGGADEALARFQGQLLSIGIESDHLFPPRQQRDLAIVASRNGCSARYLELDSPLGHDGFLIEQEVLSGYVGDFLREVEEKRRGEIVSCQETASI